MSHKPQVVTDRETRERTYHASLWPGQGSDDPSLLARGADRASHLATGTVVKGEGHFTPPLHPSYFTGHFTPDRRPSISQTVQIEASPRAELRVVEALYEAGATPPRDARCVTVTVGSLPPHEYKEAQEKSTETDEATSLLRCASGGARVNGARTTRFTHRFTESFTLKAVRSRTDYRACASRDDGFGRGQNTGVGWSDPTFGQLLVAKRPQGSLQPIGVVVIRRVFWPNVIANGRHR